MNFITAQQARIVGVHNGINIQDRDIGENGMHFLSYVKRELHNRKQLPAKRPKYLMPCSKESVIEKQIAGHDRVFSNNKEKTIEI